ncbi:hypothetical protein SAMN04487904_106213 [Actinopolyspora lacussalsi subsp. righensis]|uniref:Abi-like protein n=1 Tax=Actinopolyspora righensis TaxID=995060 RepID=A0A1I7AAZ2_9ACTN|nr:hypothetical protein [Actinopolyspora righensis]SFT72089.1 hypothetical protein SAMN04487904_106213 [Actinopolyspora righensis]
MTDKLPEWITHMLSPARLGPYLKAADGDTHHAFELYQWNLRVSAAFYTPLHWLEVGLRNTLNEAFRNYYGLEDWWSVAPLADKELATIRQARARLREQAHRRGDTPQTCADDIVAELNFGFWVALLSKGKNYDRGFWHPFLHAAFANHRGLRRELHDELDPMRVFRNRVMHYEPITNQNLWRKREDLHRLVGYFSRETAEYLRATDSLPRILSERPGPQGENYEPANDGEPV